MDQKERSADHTAGLKQALQGWQRGIWTATPALVNGGIGADQTISCTPAIRSLILVVDPKTGKQVQQWVQLPQLIKVPVQFPGGGGYNLTMPIADGDEVLVVFGSRCIDAWWQNGGVGNAIDFRAHDLSDGFAIPGFRSVPRKLSGISTTTVQLRDDAGTNYIEIDKATGFVNIHVSDQVKIFGDLFVTGEITAGADSGATVGLLTHDHNQPADSHGDSEQATTPPIPNS